jgi:hypothetical protein
MFVYLDETGDTGFKFDKGSSRYVIVTILVTTDPVPLNAEIDAFRREQRFPDNHEFKFYSSPDSVRSRFLRLLLKHECLVRCLIVDKHRLSLVQTPDSEVLYNTVVAMLLQHGEPWLIDARLILDRRHQHAAKQGLAPFVRRELNHGGVRRIRDIKYHESHRDNLLQAVDMASGAINARYARNHPEFLHIIRSRVVDIWFHPEEIRGDPELSGSLSGTPPR